MVLLFFSSLPLVHGIQKLHIGIEICFHFVQIAKLVVVGRDAVRVCLEKVTLLPFPILHFSRV